jgi:hypothetical protein
MNPKKYLSIHLAETNHKPKLETRRYLGTLGEKETRRESVQDCCKGSRLLSFLSYIGWAICGILFGCLIDGAYWSMK